MSSAAEQPSLVYRLFRQEDRPQLERLWEEETPWGTLTPELWRRYYEPGIYGDPLVTVALSGDKVIGQFVFTASQVALGAQIVPSFRAFAPILRAEFRTNLLSRICS